MTAGLLTTTVGSFAKPDYLQTARNQFAARKLSRQELDELERRATKEVIELQEEIGIDILVDGLTAEKALYLYFGDVDGIYPQVLDLPVDLIGLDFVAGARNEALLRKTPCTKKLGLGVVDARNSKLESVEQIAERIRALSDGLDPDRVHVSPSSGLEFLPREVAQEKLRRLAQAVRQTEKVPA